MQTTAAAPASTVTNGPETTTDNSLPIDVLLSPSDTFARRHIGPSDSDIESMLKIIGLDSLETLIDQTVPKAIRLKKPLRTGEPRTEHQTLIDLKAIASKNKVFRSLIGQGYHDTITPPVILRNIMENPGWYTQYTPYQAEISQGRLEALLNYQTMICDLTGLEVSNASLLDEGTAAAEAMTICRSQVANAELDTFVIDDLVHPQTIAVVKTRADSMGIKVVVACTQTSDLSKAFGALVQYPTTDGSIEDYSKVAEKLHAQGALLVAAADILSLTILKPPGEWGADIAVGSAQRFGVPMGFGGPHAGYMAVKNEFVRRMPGRLVGVSKDAHGNKAYRLTLQTREQHIRRERATSNICTAQVLLAVMAGMYAVYHGPEGLKRIAERVRLMTTLLARSLEKIGHEIVHVSFFDTLRVKPVGITASDVKSRALKAQINLRYFDDGSVGVSLDEITTKDEVIALIEIFMTSEAANQSLSGVGPRSNGQVAASTFDLSLNTFAVHDGDQSINAQKFCAPLVNRTSPILTHPIFNTHHSESEMLRYMWHLQGKDISLVHSMIPLGSCTMKLNATTEMIPVTWPEFGKLHPFAPADQWKGYAVLFKQLEKWLNEITGFDATWLQPNAGSQGEYAGLLMIREYHLARGDAKRTVCLIPESAHGTNPASAVIAGMSVVGVACKENGDIDLDDLLAKAEAHKDTLSCMMITYPSTHGVFEEGVKQACKIIHDRGGQVYMDGANMNAQVGLCRPGDIGADVCHLNLHKTFCIPHGGGGPGMGPICMKKHLAEFVPQKGLRDYGTEGLREKTSDSSSPQSLSPSVPQSLAVSAAPYGSPSILTISWAYIAMMGGVGLKRATQVAILNANYMAARLKDHYPILFTGANGRCAHEFILDCRDLEKRAGIKVEDIAKRLMDYGFHAPTMSWPVGGTLMIEPTESEPRPELDRLCDALISIRAEIRDIEEGKLDRTDNPLKNAPHTAQHALSDAWAHKYPRERAVYPLPWVREKKFWPTIGRIDNVYGDRNLVCACPPMSDYQ